MAGQKTMARSIDMVPQVTEMSVEAGALKSTPQSLHDNRLHLPNAMAETTRLRICISWRVSPCSGLDLAGSPSVGLILMGCMAFAFIVKLQIGVERN
ncbi:hypothetical protein DPEC_G00320040 [Dallia pectoralis]|uniref:Uncharacterized protein n=1 Tax=Dallia pectoralis TaxID=75939 RepID=A0ACC2F9T0_DALPE|nr:hypothetical protein DPEC_G00320040 [Dallia pectoralis]